MAALVEMHVGAMCGITVRADYRHEKLAARAMHGAPESLLLVGAVPAAFQFRLAAIRKLERHDVERVGKGVFGNASCGRAVDLPALVVRAGADFSDFRIRSINIFGCLGHLAAPLRQRDCHCAICGDGIGKFQRGVLANGGQ